VRFDGPFVEGVHPYVDEISLQWDAASGRLKTRVEEGEG
jgi:hypothetical protein